MSVVTYVPPGRSRRVAINRIALGFARHWLIVFNLLITGVLFGIAVTWLAYQQTASANRPVVINQTAVPPPPHDGTGHTWHHSDELLIGIIENGGDPVYDPRMPAFKDQLNREEVAGILAFIKSKWGREEREFQWWITIRPNPQ